jgi:hypothetical protein
MMILVQAVISVRGDLELDMLLVQIQQNSKSFDDIG